MDLSVTTGDQLLWEEIFENQRGTFVAHQARFSAKSLLPGDPSEYSDKNFVYQLPKAQLPCPPEWEWVSEWIVDMSGAVDEDGWSYAPSFQSSRWSPSPDISAAVRRRKWIRCRRPLLSVPQTPFPTPASPLDSDVSHCFSDFELLALLETFLKNCSSSCPLPSETFNSKLLLILDAFEYEHFRTAALAFCAKHNLLPKDNYQVYSRLLFYKDRVAITRLIKSDSHSLQL